jgi:N,N'-diacetyllegionaminate synthase
MFENRIYIIAEAGVNHNGDIRIAKQLIDAGKDAGVDCVKFQTWKTEALITSDAPKAAYQLKNDGEGSQFEMLKKLELTYEDFKELQNYSRQVGIDFLSTPDEQESLNFLVYDLHMPIIKVGSGEINNLLYLKQIAQKRKPVILSTGMCNMSDVERAFLTLIKNGSPEVAILHCTSEYPAALDTVNLRAMDTLRNAFQVTVGYSDHTEGIEISLAAAARGARIIEKHFTLDKSMPGPDHKASLNPSELKAMVEGIRNIEKALGDGIKRIQDAEIATQRVVKKGIYALTNLKAGEIIKEEHLVGKRPMTEMGMEEYESIVGRRLRMDIQKNTAFSRNHVSWE